MGIEPTWPAWKAGALPLSNAREIETRDQRLDQIPHGAITLKCLLTPELRASTSRSSKPFWFLVSSFWSLVSRMVGREGFEPPKAVPTDLQSAPFGRLGISPPQCSKWPENTPALATGQHGQQAPMKSRTPANPDKLELAVRLELTTWGLQNPCSAS